MIGRSTKIFASFCILALGFDSSLVAEPGSLLMSEFEALSDVQSDGRQVCSIQFRAGVKRLDGSVVVVNGTLNNFYHPEAMPGLVAKLTARNIIGQTVQPAQITFGYIRNGQLDTAPFKQGKGSDGLSRLLVLPQDMALLKKYNTFVAEARKGMWITVEVEQAAVTFQLPGFEDKPAWKQLADCEMNALNNYIKSLDGQ